MNLRTKIFKDLIEEQLASIPDITFRRLFSGFGIYSGETIFGLIHGEELYFHTDDESRTRYKQCGSTFFTGPGSKKPGKYQVKPVAVPLDDHTGIGGSWLAYNMLFGAKRACGQKNEICTGGSNGVDRGLERDGRASRSAIEREPHHQKLS
jgi:hypothetical protein